MSQAKLMTKESPFLRRVELRLAVVFYGGVSLAVYSFGHTTEIRQLWLASQAFERVMTSVMTAKVDWESAVRKERPTTSTAQVYFDLLVKFKEENNVHLTIKIDLLSGTSAGGINAIILGKSLTAGSDIRPLNQFWLEEADINKLEFNPSDPKWKKQSTWTGWFVGKMVGWASNMFAAQPKALTQIPTKHIQYGVNAVISSLPLFDGDNFHRTLARGLAAMDTTAKTVPPIETPLTVFTTFTTLKSIRNPITTEPQHSIVLRFDKDCFTRSDTNRELAFAARATSAFPLAFPGITLLEGAESELLDENKKVIGKAKVDEFLKPQLRRWTVDQKIPGFFEHENADGGIMLNKPFSPIIEELNERRMTRGKNTQRRILFLEPNPAPSHGEDIVLPMLHGKKPVPKLFPTETDQGYGDLLPSFQARFEAKREAALKKEPKEDGYKWLPHVGKVANAATSQPIEDEIRQLGEFNESLKRVNDFALRSVFRLKVVAKARFATVKHEYVHAFWDCDVPIASTEKLMNLPRDMLYYSALTLASEDEQKVFLDARFSAFLINFGTTLCGKKYLDFPDGTAKQLAMVSKVIKYFPKPQTNTVQDAFEKLVENNLYFLRDMLFSVVRVLENPTWMTDDIHVDASMTSTIYDLSTFIQEQIGAIDDAIATPPAGWNMDIFHRETFEASDFDLLRDDWRKKFTEYYHGTLVGVEKILAHSGHVEEELRSLRQLVYRPLFTHSYFEVMSFPFMSGVPLGDNAVTKTVRLSPDSTDKHHEGTETALFHDARREIRREGLVSFAQVVLRSTDLSNFGGFLERKYREFDIVWGRLDGTEQLCEVLFDAIRDETQRETREAKFTVGHAENVPDRHKVDNQHDEPLFAFRAAEQVLLDETGASPLTPLPVVNDAENKTFFTAMLTNLRSRIQTLEQPSQ